MRTKTLQEQFNLIKEGKGHKGVFLTEAKRMFPNKIRNAATYDEAANKLLHENVISLQPVNNFTRHEDSWVTSFKNFISEEAKAEEKKPSKEVEEAAEKAYNTKDVKETNNQIFDQYLKGLQFESTQAPDKTLDEIKSIVEKNLEKNPLHYMEEAAFGVKGIGYEQKEVEEVSGKHKESGYSDKLKKSDNKDVPVKEGKISLTSLIKESLIETYSEFQRDDKGSKDVDAKDKGEEDAFGAGVEKGEKIEKAKAKKKVKKETVDSKLAEIEKQGKLVTMEAQMDALDELISSKQQRVEMVTEDDDLSELADKKKIKSMEREIKELEKRRTKMEKLYEKMCGKSYTREEVIDEMDAVSWNDKNNPSRGAAGERDPKKVGQSTSDYSINKG